MAPSYHEFLGGEFDRTPLCQVIGFHGRPNCEDGFAECAVNPARHVPNHIQGVTLEQATTLMIRNVHNRYKAEDFLQELCLRGFRGRFDFCYLPVDFGSAKSKGYAFLNLLTEIDACQFYKEFHGKPMLLFRKIGKPVEVAPSFTQGLHANLCWYLERHTCRVLSPRFQPLLVPQTRGKTIAYPLHEYYMSLLETGEIDTYTVSGMAWEIITKFKAPEPFEPDQLCPNMIFYV